MNSETAVGFKEWQVVCEALAHGFQSVILRKGGIAEGRHGFRFEHGSFHLFPTQFHEQLDRVRLPEGMTPPAAPPAGEIRIELFAEVQWSRHLTQLEEVRRLEPFHIWKPEIVEERFHYGRGDGLEVALLRVYRLAEPWVFPDAPRYGGCRSWVRLPEQPAAAGRTPVYSDHEFEKLDQRLRDAMEGVGREVGS